MDTYQENLELSALWSATGNTEKYAIYTNRKETAAFTAEAHMQNSSKLQLHGVTDPYMHSLSDLHMHCSFSTDSDASPESMVEKAIALGLSAICFTDHNDFDYPLEDGIIPFQLDYNAYTTKIAELQQQYQDQIQIYLGVEQGLTRSAVDRIEQYDPEHKLDFIIGSSHLVYGKDPYYPEFWDHYSAAEAVTYYYESILDNLSCCHNFDVYGHLDYVLRYAPEQDRNYDWHKHAEIIDEILKKIISSGKGIEINTAGLKYGMRDANPCKGIVKRYHELGGEIITIGSDAHKPEHLAYSYEKVKGILTEAGFHSYCIFQKRRPHFVSFEY